MKNYTITVNGNVYDVTVEETGSSTGTAAPRRAAAAAAAPAALRLRLEPQVKYLRLRRMLEMP